MIAVDARIDDRDRHAVAVGVAPVERQARTGEWAVAAEVRPAARRERLAPGRQRFLAHRRARPSPLVASRWGGCAVAARSRSGGRWRDPGRRPSRGASRRSHRRTPRTGHRRTLASRDGHELVDGRVGTLPWQDPHRRRSSPRSSSVMSARRASARIDLTSRVRAATLIAVAACRAKSDAISMSCIVNGPCPLVEHLEDADRANAVLERHRQDRPRDISRLLRDFPAEPRVVHGIGHRDALAGREHVARHTLGRAGSSCRPPAGPVPRQRRRTAARRWRRRRSAIEAASAAKMPTVASTIERRSVISTSVSIRTAVSARSATSRRIALAARRRGLRAGAAGAGWVAGPHHRDRSTSRRTSTITRSCGSVRIRPSDTSSDMRRFTLCRVPPIIAARSDCV